MYTAPPSTAADSHTHGGNHSGRSSRTHQAPMSNTPAQLGAMLAARTPQAKTAAVADVNVVTLSTVTRVCERLLDRTAILTWKTADYVAQDVLIDALPSL